MTAPREIVELTERFNRNHTSYASPLYNETQLRREFIDPFFETLGWDMHNKRGHAEAYKDVIHEDAIKVGGFTKAPDYCFRIGGARKFFLETKKPAVNLAADATPAFQLRRYAWSAKLPLSILTNFAIFAVYDCRVRPSATDKAPTGRVLYLTASDYIDRWEEMSAVFSRDAVLRGDFDRYIETARAKRGTAEVDEAFLNEIEAWRDTLARNIALRNPDISQRELNFAVQSTIDRVIFLRICEDRGIEDYGRLRASGDDSDVYGRLSDIFRSADERYNSGLFHFRPEKERTEPPDTLTLALRIDDKPLKEIIRNLYYPDSPYEFSVLPADILGQVYEQFLGKVIRLTHGHRAVVEDKPEVKKAGGVYYTPANVVDYIVENTVGELLKGKTVRQASRLRLLDPACGSGSFLIRAYQYLLDWHRDKYLADGSGSHAQKVHQGPGGNWRLTAAERKRILLNNIFGVDIDSQAVEVTKLSLLLKVLEGESSETLTTQLRFFRERALPDLGDNIKCGNSLIGPDYFHNQQISLLDDEELYRVNAFDWHAEFARAFKGGGFDSIIGNPPWGADIRNDERTYLKRLHSEVADFESSQYFLMKSLSLLNDRGMVGMILPNTFALNVYAKRCRDKLLSTSRVRSILDLSDIDVFLGPHVRSLVTVAGRNGSRVGKVFKYERDHKHVRPLRRVSQRQLADAETWKQILTEDTPLFRLVQKLVKQNPTLADYADVRQGYIPYRTTTLTRRFGRSRAREIVEGRLYHATERLGPEYQRELQGADVGRYTLSWSGTWVKYGEWVSTYLPINVFSGSRVLVREITNEPPKALSATYTEETFVHNPSVLAVLPKTNSVSAKFIVGILNSKLMGVIFSNVGPKAEKGLFPKIIITDAKRLPFPELDLQNLRERKQHDQLVHLVEKILESYQKLGLARTPQERNTVKRQVATLDDQIDHLIFTLYRIKPMEKKLIEDFVPGL